MLATPHFLAGAAIGTTIRQRWIVAPLAFASHFLLDFTPHLDSHAMFGAPGGHLTRGEIAAAVVDGVIGLTLLAWLARGHPARKYLWWGAFFAMLIDIADNLPPWGDWFSDWPPTAGLSTFHHAFQHNVTPAQWPLGMGTQLTVVLFSIWVVRRNARLPLPANESQPSRG